MSTPPFEVECEQPAASVLSMQRARDVAALDRSVASTEGRGKAVVVQLGSDEAFEAGLQCIRAREVTWLSIRARLADRERLSKQIFEALAQQPCDHPQAILRDYVHYLAATEGQLCIVMGDGASLPLDAAEWLGDLIRESGGALRVVLQAEPGERIAHVCDALALPVLHIDSRGAKPIVETQPAALEAPRVQEQRAPRARHGIAAHPWIVPAGFVFLMLGTIWLMVFARWHASSSQVGPKAPPAAAAPAALEAPIALETWLTHFRFDPVEQRVSFLVEGVPRGRVLRSLARRIGFGLRLDGDLTGLVTLRVEDVPLGHALKQLCGDLRCVLVYDASAEAGPRRRLRELIVLPESQHALETRHEAVQQELTPHRPGDPSSVREIVSDSIGALLRDATESHHQNAVDALMALDPQEAGHELLSQFGSYTPVGPVAPIRRQAAWDRLRTAICTASARHQSPVPPELGCGPPPSTSP